MLPREPTLGFDQRVSLLQTHLEPMVNGELIHRRLGKDQVVYRPRWVGGLNQISSRLNDRTLLGCQPNLPTTLLSTRAVLGVLGMVRRHR